MRLPRLRRSGLCGDGDVGLPAHRGGHFRNLLPLFKMVLSWRPLLRENARKFVGIDNGYVLPHSVDDRGVCFGGKVSVTPAP